MTRQSLGEGNYLQSEEVHSGKEGEVNISEIREKEVRGGRESSPLKHLAVERREVEVAC